jgi:hypothetical protein
MTLICYSVVRDHSASVHRTGCRDIEADVKRHSGHAVVVLGTAEDAVNEWLGDKDREGDPANLGYHSYDVKVHNCAKPHKV